MPRSRAPWLSVVVPTFNGERHLEAALASIEAQVGAALDDVEVLAVDDGSTDSTLAILEAFRSRIPLRILVGEPLHNWAANTNRGFRDATGSYVSVLHQDDLWRPTRLASMRQLANEVPEASLLLHAVDYVDDAGGRVGRWSCPFPPNARRLTREYVLERLLVQNFISMPAPLFSTQLVLDVGGLKAELWYAADWDLWLNLVERSPCIGYTRERLAAYRLHAQAQTNTRSHDARAFRQELLLALESHLHRWQRAGSIDDTRVEDVARFSVEANSYLAARAHGRARGGAALLYRFARLGPSGWRRYARDSRIGERTLARIRALGLQL